LGYYGPCPLHYSAGATSSIETNVDLLAYDGQDVLFSFSASAPYVDSVGQMHEQGSVGYTDVSVESNTCLTEVETISTASVIIDADATRLLLYGDGALELFDRPTKQRTTIIGQRPDSYTNSEALTPTGVVFLLHTPAAPFTKLCQWQSNQI